jgi:hypothetical protein
MFETQNQKRQNMLTEIEVEKLFADHRIQAFQVEIEGAVDNGCKMRLFEKNLHDFIDFCGKRNIDTVFYHYTYYDSEAACIGEDVLEKVIQRPELIEMLQPKIDKYNEKINKLDFNKPAGLKVYCIYQGVFIYVQEDDAWFEALGYTNAYIAAMELFTKDADKLLEQAGKESKKRQDIREECRKIILKDPKFHGCTNLSMRRFYSKEFFDKNKKYKDAFYSEDHGYYDVLPSDFVEFVWKEFKSSLASSKDGG